MSVFDWTTFLTEWSRELLALKDLAAELPHEVVASGWLGYPGAREDQLARAEAHLGRALPPSYRDFLRVTNGWRYKGPFIKKLWSTDEIEWFSVRHQEWIDAYVEAYADGMEGESGCHPAQLYTALEISAVGDAAIYLLNAQTVGADGEWEAWFFADWNPGAITYPSFKDLVLAERAKLAALYAR
jgi:SMI1 / KNR4 family (SUKH-1)